jgi:parallel beta-helix repeat protein
MQCDTTRFVKRSSIGAVSLTAALLAGCGSSGTSSTPIPAPTQTTGLSTTVINLNDSGNGSLRAAIQRVNALHSGNAIINFTVNGTIALASALPSLTSPVDIDATTAPTFGGSAPVVAVNFNGQPGLVFATGSQGSQLYGLALENASGNGVTLDAGSITLNHNYIGLNLAGAAAGNKGDGLSVSSTSTGNFIGLNAKNASGVVGNVISGNTGNGISFHGSSSNTVVANRIGTDPTGATAIGNGANGIWITAASSANEIGGTVFTDSATGLTNNPTGNKGTIAATFIVPPLGNQVSGNHLNGILIDSGSQTNVLNGNFVGTTADGDAALGNGADGVFINGASGNSLIGCAFVNNPFVYYNVLDGNGANGLHVSNSNNVTVQANFFGAGANNATGVPNKGDGILVDGTSQNTQVGGVIPLGNVSAGNAQNGIEVKDTASSFETFNTFGGILAFQGALGNGRDGILITSTGGNQTVRTNVFSGNAQNGIEIGGNASGVTVDPNVVGLNTIGSAPVPNGNDGLLIDGTAHGIVVGGYLSSVIPQNIFSGNAAYGVEFTAGAHDNQIFNSYIGTNTSGMKPMPNGKGGVYVGGTAINTMIGGTSTQAQAPTLNLISGNTGNGVTLAAGTSFTQVLNNWIGLDSAERSLLPNSGLPIVADPASSSNTITGNVTAVPAVGNSPRG